MIKQIAKVNISGLVVATIFILIAIFTGNEELIGILLETSLSETRRPEIQDAEEGAIITLTIANDGDILRNGDAMKLAGGLDFLGKKGDAVIFQIRDGIWTQIGVYLVDERDLQ